MPQTAGLLTFDGFELDVERRELRRDGAPVDIDPKPLALLVYLAQHRDRAVSKEELLRQVWPDVVVSETALSSALKDLRRTLGDDGASQRLIRTRRRRGYRFVAPVREPGAARDGGRLEEEGGPLVGRVAELSSLERLVRDAERGLPQVILVRGQAGVGKTRLLSELRQSPAGAPFVLVRGVCHEGDAVPYRPFIEALSSWLVLLEEDAEWAASEDEPALRQLLQSGVGTPRGSAEPELLDGHRHQLELFAAFGRAVLRLAQRRPTLLWIDDLHVADPATLQLLAHLAAELVDEMPSRRTPFVLVGSYRFPDATAERLRELERQPDVHLLTLEGLSADATSDLLASLVRPAPAEAVQRRVHEATGGNPFFVRELVRAAEESFLELDALLEAPSRRTADVRSLMAARVARLSPRCREVLAVGSFIGDRFGRLALAAATGVEEWALAPLLEEAADSDLLACDGRTHHFTHPLVRQVLQSQVDEHLRRGIHARVADVLEDLYAGSGGEHALEIAHHLLLAGSDVAPARTLRLARRAGNQAFATCAWHAAARFYDGALASGADLGLAECATLHLRAGVAHNHDRKAEACAAHYQRAAALFERTGDAVGLCFARMYLVRARFSMGPVGAPDPEELEALEALAERVATAHPGLRGLLLETVSEAHWAAGDVPRAALQADRALRIGQDLDDDLLCHHASMGLALARFSRLEVREAVDDWREALERARRLQDPWLEAAPGPRLAMGLLLLGHLEHAGSAAREGREAASRVRHSAELSLIAAQEAVLELCAGRLDAAERQVEEAMRWVERSRYPWAAPFALAAAACVRACRMDWSGAHRALDVLMEPKRLFEEPPGALRLMVAVYRELISAQRDPRDVDVERAAHVASMAGRAAPDASLLSPLCALVEVAARAGAPAVAEPVLGTLELAAQRGVVLTQGWVFLVPRVLGLASGLLGRQDEACVRLGRAVDVARDVGARTELARTLVDAARAWRLRRAEGDGRRAATALAEARALAEAFGLRGLVREARELGAEQ